MAITVKRLSDNHTYEFYDIEPKNLVRSLKSRIRKDFMPSSPNGCRLLFNNQVLKSRHSLKHYKIDEKSVIEMDDRKNWSSSSSESDSTK